jgi:hypothetical protein
MILHRACPAAAPNRRGAFVARRADEVMLRLFEIEGGGWRAALHRPERESIKGICRLVRAVANRAPTH